MRSVQDYCKWAAQAKRLAAAGTADWELQEQLESIAREYEAIAERIERFQAGSNSG
jgi:hypothetical protein